MKQFGKILKFELKYYFKNKVFVGVTIFLVLLIAVVMFLPRIVGMIKDDGEGTDSSPSERSVMLIKAETPREEEAVRKACRQ